SQDRDRLLNMITVLFGGRVAEELFMHQMTTGASNDFERATEIARRMVTQWGMSDELGTMVYGENEGEIFLGRSSQTHKNVPPATPAPRARRRLRLPPKPPIVVPAKAGTQFLRN